MRAPYINTKVQHTNRDDWRRGLSCLEAIVVLAKKKYNCDEHSKDNIEFLIRLESPKPTLPKPHWLGRGEIPNVKNTKCLSKLSQPVCTKVSEP